MVHNRTLMSIQFYKMKQQDVYGQPVRYFKSQQDCSVHNRSACTDFLSAETPPSFYDNGISLLMEYGNKYLNSNEDFFHLNQSFTHQYFLLIVLLLTQQTLLLVFKFQINPYPTILFLN